MADKDKKKPKTVEEIVSDYQKYHHSSGKAFKERIKKWEEFHDPDNIHVQQFIHHAHYTVFGKPDDLKSFPGAYNEAYKVLSKHVKEDDGKLEDEDKLAQILETYTDTFLQKAMGDKFKEAIEHAEKELKLSKKDMREMKGQLMMQYYAEEDEEGHLRSKNILTEDYVKNLKGKKKVELISKLQKIGEGTKSRYWQVLAGKSMEGLLTEEDRIDMAKYIHPIFQERGFKHKYSHLTRSVEEQAKHYGLLLRGEGKQLQEKEGYEIIKYKPKEKDDKKK